MLRPREEESQSKDGQEKDGRGNEGSEGERHITGELT